MKKTKKKYSFSLFVSDRCNAINTVFTLQLKRTLKTINCIRRQTESNENTNRPNRVNETNETEWNSIRKTKRRNRNTRMKHNVRGKCTVEGSTRNNNNIKNKIKAENETNWKKRRRQRRLWQSTAQVQGEKENQKQHAMEQRRTGERRKKINEAVVCIWFDIIKILRPFDAMHQHIHHTHTTCVHFGLIFFFYHITFVRTYTESHRFVRLMQCFCFLLYKVSFHSHAFHVWFRFSFYHSRDPQHTTTLANSRDPNKNKWKNEIIFFISWCKLSKTLVSRNLHLQQEHLSINHMFNWF